MEMERPTKGTLTTGARLLLRGWRVLAWAYVVNLLLGIVAALPLASTISEILDHSLEADRLAKGFDLGAFFGLLMHPEVTLSNFVPGSFFVSLLFLFFMLFLTGGLLADFRHDKRLSFGAFLDACGAFFWRFVRLLLFMLLAMVPLGILFDLLNRGAANVTRNSPRDSVNYSLVLGCMLITALLFFAIRLWFDVAQICAVAENQPKIRRALGKSFRMTFGNFGSLFWILLRIGIVALAGSAAAAWFFVQVIRPEQVGLTIVFCQVFVFFWLTIRFWLRACETVWYQRKFPAPVAFAEAPILPTPAESDPPSLPAPPLATPPDDTSA